MTGRGSPDKISSDFASADPNDQDFTDSKDSYEKRRKAFNPIRSLKKFFGNHGSRRNLEVEGGETDLIGLKAKSTTDMLRATHKVADEETVEVNPLPRKQMSLSADSVFSLEKTRDPGVTVPVPLMARSTESISNEARTGVDLAQSQLNRCRDDDEGHPHSPLTLLTTTADVITETTAKLDKWPSFDSGHSLLSVESSENELDDDFFKEKWLAVVSSGLGKEASDNSVLPVADADLSLVRRHASLNTCAAAHRLTVKQKNKRVSSVYHQKMQAYAATQKPIEIIEVLPELQEESVLSRMKIDEFSTSRSLAAEAAMKVMRKAEPKELTGGIESEIDTKVKKRNPKLSLLSNDEMVSRRLTVSGPSVSAPADQLPIGGKIISKRSSMHVTDVANEKSSNSPEATVTEFSQIFSKFQRRSSQKEKVIEQTDSKQNTDNKETEKIVAEKHVPGFKSNFEMPKLSGAAHSVSTQKASTIELQKPAGSHPDVHTPETEVVKIESNLKPETKVERGTTFVLNKSSTGIETTGISNVHPAPGSSVEPRKNIDSSQDASANQEVKPSIQSVTRTPSTRIYGAKLAQKPATGSNLPSAAITKPPASTDSVHITRSDNATAGSLPLKNIQGASSEVEKPELSTIAQKHKTAFNSSASGKNVIFTSGDDKVSGKAPEKLVVSVKSTTVFPGTPTSLSLNSSKVIHTEKKVVESDAVLQNPVDSKPKLDTSSPSDKTVKKEASPGVSSTSKVQKSYSISYKAAPIVRDNSVPSPDNNSKNRSYSHSESTTNVDQLLEDAGNTQFQSPADTKHKQQTYSEKKLEMNKVNSAAGTGTVLFSSAKSVDNSTVKSSVVSQSSHISANQLILPSPASRDNKMSKSLDSVEIKKATGIVTVPTGSNVSVGNVPKPTVRSSQDGCDAPLIIGSSVGVKSSSAGLSTGVGGVKGKPTPSSTDNNADGEPAWFAMARRKTKDWNDGRL